MPPGDKNGTTINASPYAGVDYDTEENGSQSKQLSEQGQQRVATEDRRNAELSEAMGADLRPLGAENPVQTEDPYLPDGSENPNFKWDAPPPADRPSFVDAKDIEAQKQAQRTAVANQQAAEQQAALQQRAAKQAEEWGNRIMADADELAKVSDPRKLMADPREPGPRRWLQTIMIGLNNGANVVAGGNGEGALQRQINHDLDLDMERKKLSLEAVLKRAQQDGASAEALAEIAKKGGDRIEATRQALLKRFESDTMAALAPYPQHRQAAMLELAKVNQASAKRMSDLVTERTGETKEHKHTSVTGDKGGTGDKPPPTADTMNYTNAMENEKKAIKLEKHLARGEYPSPKELREIVDRQNKIMASYEEEKKSVGSSYAAQAKRAVGLLPDSIFPKGMSAAKKEAYTLRWQLAEPEAIRATGGISWMTNPEAFQAVMGRRVHQPGEDAEMGLMKDKQLVEGAKAAAEELRRVSKVGVREQRLEGRARSQKPGLDLAKAVAKLPDSLQKTISKSLKSSDPKTRAAAVDYLQKVGAGQ